MCLCVCVSVCLCVCVSAACIGVIPAADRTAIEAHAAGLALGRRTASVRSDSRLTEFCACERPQCESNESNEEAALVEISVALLQQAQGEVDFRMPLIDEGLKKWQQAYGTGNYSGGEEFVDAFGGAHDLDDFAFIEGLSAAEAAAEVPPSTGPQPEPEPQQQTNDYYQQLHADYWAWVNE